MLPRPGLAMTFNVDGFGDRPNKLAKYASFTAQTRGRPFADGYKLFYHEDTNLMKPADVMRMQGKPAPAVKRYVDGARSKAGSDAELIASVALEAV